MQTDKKEIKTGKKTIGTVFSEWYNVPSYQRHYVWEKDNIVDLLDDIVYAVTNTPHDEYFLGSYVIQSKVDGNDLLDGQQRLTTLFVLFAVLRDMTNSSNEVKNLCQQYVFQKENKLTKAPNRVRLLYQIRDNASNFISDCLIRENSINDNIDRITDIANSKKYNPTICNMSKAILIIQDYFNDNQHVDIDDFMTYIVNNVVLIYVSADSLHDAFRFFSILNDRGIKLNNSDIIKSLNLQKCSETESIRYAKQWETMQEELGDDFDRFLSHVRTIIIKEKAKNNLLDEFEKLIFETNIIKPGVDFFKYIENAYSAYSDLYEDASSLVAENIYLNNFIVLLKHSLPATDWMAVLMSYYMKFKLNNINLFIKKLACKTIGDWVCGESPSRRIEALNKIIQAIETKSDLEGICSLDIFDFDQIAFCQNIERDVYGKAYLKSLLLILDFIYNDNSSSKWNGLYQISIEHILPQNPASDSEWCKDFTDEQLSLWTNKIANLCLIGRKKNTSLGRLDYIAKKEKYFKDKIANFPYTLHIYNTYPDKWTPQEVNSNQIELLSVLNKFFTE